MWRLSWALRFVLLGMGLRGRRLIRGFGLGGGEMVLKHLLREGLWDMALDMPRGHMVL